MGKKPANVALPAQYSHAQMKMRARAQSVDSSTDSSWGIASEHESFKSMVDDTQRYELNGRILDGPFRRAGLHRSFSFQGSSGLRSRYLTKVKPHLYRHPEDNWEIESLSFTRLSGHQRKTISCLWAAKLSYFFALGMLPVVLPPIVEAKGYGSTAVGTLFAVWGLSTILFWPLWQMAISKLGTKNLLTIGLFLTGISYLVFGSLHFGSDSEWFLILAYVIRVVEGAGFAALEIGITAKVLAEFPRHESGAYGTTQNCIGLGLTIGSCFGGFLYNVEDIAASLMTCGLLLFLTGLISICLLEKRPYIYSTIVNSGKHRRRFLRQPAVWASITMLFCGMFTVGSLITVLEPHLHETFQLHFTVEGIILAVMPLSFAFGAALWQWLITHDFVYGLDSVNISGLLVIAITLLFLAPCRAFNFPKDLLWLNVICFLAIGGAFSMVYTATMNSLLEEAELKKMNKLGAYSTITTMTTVTQCIGILAGAPIGGYLNQFHGFQFSMTVLAFVLFGISALGLIYCIIKCSIRLQNMRKMKAAARLEQAQARLAARDARAPIIGASLAVETKKSRAHGYNSHFKKQRLEDRRPLLPNGAGKGRSYGTYL